MQIEKLNDDKLKVILNSNDLKENDIDLNTFMANSLESQELFLDILDLAEEKFNFYVNDSKLIIESISLANNIFIFTITKLSDCKDSTSENFVYCFDNFNQLADIFHLFDVYSVDLYTYNNKFYLIINKNNKMNLILDEFSIFKTDSKYIENILFEHGNLYKNSRI